MTNKKELSVEEDLEKVNGGHFRDKYLPADKGEHISAKDAKDHINENVYFVDDSDREIFGWGKLMASEQRYNGIAIYLFHDIFVEGRNNYEVDEIPLNQLFSIKSNNWTLFKKNS